MKLKKLTEGLGYTACPCDEEVTLITDDSRKVTEGCLFVCIKGANFDGHTVAEQALSNGAVAVVTEYDLGLERQIIADNTRSAYCKLSAAFFGHPEDKLEIVGVTGTNGKTTTCFILKGIFDNLGIKSGLIGTVKNMVDDKEYPASFTTPTAFELFSLLSDMVDAGCEYCFMEVSSQALDQKRVDAIRFSAAVFTNLSRDHLDYHGTIENYMAAKKQLFSMTNMAIVNFDDPAGREMLDGVDCRRITYSAVSDQSSYCAKNIRTKPDAVEYELLSDSKIGRARFCVPGNFSVYNSMAAVICAIELGIGFDDALEALAKCRAVKGRAEVVPTDTDYTVIVDYAHTPDGLENVLTSLKELADGRLICVFGCGGDRDKTKRPLMGEIAEKYADLSVVTSDNPRSEDPDAIIEDILKGMKDSSKYIVEPDRRKATAKALKKAKAGDIVLLAGKGHETYQILASGKIHYDEREVVAEILNSSGC